MLIQALRRIKEIGPAKKIFFMITILIQFATTVASYYMQKKQTGIERYMLIAIFYVSMIACLFFLFGFIVSFIVTTRVV